MQHIKIIDKNSLQMQIISITMRISEQGKNILLNFIICLLNYATNKDEKIIISLKKEKQLSLIVIIV